MFKEGNSAAFDLLFEKFRVPVFNFIYRMLNRQKGPAEDLLQEIFVKVVQGKEFYEPEGRFSTWLFSIARNHCLNFLKSRTYKQDKITISIDIREEESGLVMSDKLARHRNDGSTIEQKEFRNRFEETISTLPEKYREIFLLHAVEGLTHQEISKILKINPATIRTDYHRAKLLIKEKIGVLPEEKET